MLNKNRTAAKAAQEVIVKRSSVVGTGLVKLTPERKELIGQLLGLESKAVVSAGVAEYLVESVLLLADLLMQAEVREVAGERYKRDDERVCSRWGSQPGQICALGQKVQVEKPRVRAKGGAEVELETYKALSEPELLQEQMVTKLLAGVSTRRYATTLEKVLRRTGVSRQSVSRRAISEMAASLEEFRNRRFDDLDVLAIFIDGIHLADRVHIAAVGLDSRGKKHVLGITQGGSEHHEVCKDLLADLLNRGLRLDASYLFVIDGSKALAKAIREVFAKRSHIQRCLEHKKRNVEARLPKEYAREFRHKVEAAYAKPTLKQAEDAFDRLRRWLLLKSPTAADRLVDGLQDILTLHRLGISGRLRKSLCTTNSIESIFSSARYYLRNVKRWRKEEQMDRWLAAGLLQAEKSLRSVPGYTQLTKLKKILKG